MKKLIEEQAGASRSKQGQAGKFRYNREIFATIAISLHSKFLLL